MPFVNVKVTRENLSEAKKQEVIAGITDVLVKTLNKNPQTTMIVIEEIDSDNWGLGGETVTRRRQKGQ